MAVLVKTIGLFLPLAAVLMTGCSKSSVGGTGVHALPAPLESNRTRKLQQAGLKIVGSDATRVTSGYDYNALIQFSDGLLPPHTCTGTLISPKHVLTAGHCCFKKDQIGPGFIDMDITLAAYTLNKDTEQFGAGLGVEGAVVLYADRYTVPKDFYADPTKWHLDICVIILQHPVDIPPAKLATLAEDRLHTKTPGFVYGWGQQVDIDDAPPVTELRGWWGQTAACGCYGDGCFTAIWLRSKSPRFICLPPTSNGSPCSGDSGGPLVIDGVVWGFLISSDGFLWDADRCLPPNNKMNIFINLASPAIQDFIAEALAKA